MFHKLKKSFKRSKAEDIFLWLFLEFNIFIILAAQPSWCTTKIALITCWLSPNTPPAPLYRASPGKSLSLETKQLYWPLLFVIKIRKILKQLKTTGSERTSFTLWKDQTITSKSCSKVYNYILEGVHFLHGFTFKLHWDSWINL